MARADSVAAIGEWAADVTPEEAAALGARRDRRCRPAPPAPSTFRRVLRRLDGEAVAAAFGAWLEAQLMAGLEDAPSLVIALDGKAVCGARTAEGRAPHLLAAMITGAQAVIAQRDVDAKTNEITQVRPLLAGLDITGALVTADALHVQRDTARYLVEDKKADYLFTAVKDNQPGLFAALDPLAWENVPVATRCRTRATAGTKPGPSRCCPRPRAAFLTRPRRSWSRGWSGTRETAVSALPSRPSASPAGPRSAAARRKRSPSRSAATGTSRPCTMSATSP